MLPLLSSPRRKHLGHLLSLLFALLLSLPSVALADPQRAVPHDFRTAAFNGLSLYAKAQFQRLEGKTRVERTGPGYEWRITYRTKLLGLGRVDQVAVKVRNEDGGASEHFFDVVSKRRARGMVMLKEHSVRQYGVGGEPLGEAVEYRCGGALPIARKSSESTLAWLRRWTSAQLGRLRRSAPAR
jgi:hypothetical protein